MTYPKPIVRRVSGRGSFVLGRSSQANVVLADASVSRLHARLTFGVDRVEVEDLGSANGTRFVVVEHLASTTNVREVELEPNLPRSVPANATVHLGDVTVLVRPAQRPIATCTDVVAHSPAMLQTLAVVQQLAHSALHVALVGEVGVGRDTLARSLHKASNRASAPYVALSCQGRVDAQLEQELFGYERGAFRGAHEARAGLLERAQGGTLMLDGVDHLSQALQKQLLRALANRQLQRLGEREARPLDVRLIAGVTEETPLLGALQKLGAVILRVPPLRERREDIPELARVFVARAAGAAPPPPLSPSALHALADYHFPENVRELGEIVTRAVPLAGRGAILSEHLLLRSAFASYDLADESDTTQVREVPKLS